MIVIKRSTYGENFSWQDKTWAVFPAAERISHTPSAETSFRLSPVGCRAPWSASRQAVIAPNQGRLTEGEGSIWLTSLRQLI
jgi:hypothetical protein